MPRRDDGLMQIDFGVNTGLPCPIEVCASDRIRGSDAAPDDMLRPNSQSNETEATSRMVHQMRQ